MEVYETTILRPLHKLINVFASCFVRSALGLPLRTDWLSESAGSQLSPAAYKKSWRALEYKALLSSIRANFLQLSP